MKTIRGVQWPAFAATLTIGYLLACAGCTSRNTAKSDKAETVAAPSKDEDAQPPAIPIEASSQPSKPEEPQETWSKMRLVALAPTGPVVMDLYANVSGRSLEEVSESAASRGLAQVEKDMPKPWEWEKFLEHPLVASGWLGNEAVMDAKRNDVITRFNTDGDEYADDDELPAFFSRREVRKAAFRFTDVGYEPTAMDLDSTWGTLDINEDANLDKDELTKAPESLMKLDSNGDRSIAFSEFTATLAMASTAPNANQSMMQDVKSVIDVSSGIQAHKVSANVLQHCASGQGAVTRDQWPNWTDAQWKALDKNSDQLISAQELEAITTGAAHFELRVRLRDVEKAAGSSAFVSGKSTDGNYVWESASETIAQIHGNAATISFRLEDSFPAPTKESLRREFAEALTNAEATSRIKTRFQLNDAAFSLLDPNEDDQLTDEEFENAWSWLTFVRGSRLQIKSVRSQSAWFRFADGNGDDRITEVEMRSLPMRLAKLDFDGDGLVSAAELPLTIRVVIARGDSRFNAETRPSMQSESSGGGWFAASDSNADGFVGISEFLGSLEDFSAYDSNNDGFISPSEAYKSPAGRVQ